VARAQPLTQSRRVTWPSFWRLRSRGFLAVLLETVFVALLLRGAAVLLTRMNVPQPWAELLALLSEHTLWLLPALRLARFSERADWPRWTEVWRVLRVPLIGALCGLAFGVIGAWLTAFLPPTRNFFSFQALIVPDSLRPNVALLTLTTALRFSFVYAVRAVWLEGQRSLRWRLTALALFGGVFAASIVAILPGLVALVRDPSRNLTGEALGDAASLSKLFQGALGLGYDDAQLRRLFDYLESAPHTRQAIIEGDDLEIRANPNPLSNRVALLLTPDGQVIASSDVARYANGIPLNLISEPWAGLLAVAATGRCRAIIVTNEVLAACPVQAAPAQPLGGIASGRARNLLVAGIIRPIQSAVPFTDFAAQITHDFTSALDTLSQGFLPFFLGLGFLGYVAALRLTRPLDQLLEGVQAITAGQFQTRVPLENDDEVTRLSAGFNAMARQLQQNVQELQQEKINVEDLLDSNRTLTANASHELRTPLAVMRAHLESAELRGEALNPAETELLRREVHRLERLVEDLFALSRAELQRLEMVAGRVSLPALVTDLVRALEPLATTGSVTLLNSVSAGLIPVSADPERLEQVLRNLVTNAIRYTPEGGIVRLSARARGDVVSVSVQDTGIGIDTEDLSRIFEPFYRTDPARTRSSGGSGLGLALVRELLERMGGRIRAESITGRGSTFTLELPVWREGVKAEKIPVTSQ
jgi:signal transduction histidine kinase